MSTPVKHTDDAFPAWLSLFVDFYQLEHHEPEKGKEDEYYKR